MRKFKLIIFLLASFFCMPDTAHAQLLVTDSSAANRDNSIFSESNNSNALGQNLFAGRNGQGFNRRALIRFSTLSFQPDSFKSVSMRIFVNQVSNANPYTLRLYKLNSNWGEGTSSSASGAGGSPTTNDATWNFRFFNTLSWSTAGGDYSATLSATVQVTDVGYYTFSNPQMLADYKSWISNPSANFGWIIIGDEAVNNSAKRLSSREAAAVEIPKIFATYNPSVVPFKLLSFSAKKMNGFNRLHWQYEDPQQSLFSCRVLYSETGNNFREIHWLPGLSNFNLISYDHVVKGQDHFYQLLIEDKSGQKTYSSIEHIKGPANALSVFPNPAGEALAIRGLENGPVEISDISGRAWFISPKSPEKIDIRNLPPGIYFLRNQGRQFSFIKK